MPGFEAGVTQYRKSPTQLAEIAFAQQGYIRDLIGGTHSPITRFFQTLAIQGSRHGLNIRPACFAGLFSGRRKAGKTAGF